MSGLPILDTPENWDAASEGYSKKIAPYIMETFAGEFVELLEVDNTSEVLEVAAGSGALTMTLAKSAKSVLATDFSPKMLELLRARVQLAGLNNVSYAQMDGQALDLENNMVDRGACSFGLMLFPDRSKGFSELHRTVRPGGKVLVSGWATPDKFEALGLFMTAIQKTFPDMPKPDTPPPVLNLSNLSNFKTEMEAAGFKNVKVDFISRELTIKNFDQMWAMLTIGAPPVKKLTELVGEAGLEKIRDSLAEIVENKFGNGPIVITNTATVGVGTAS